MNKNFRNLLLILLTSLTLIAQAMESLSNKLLVHPLALECSQIVQLLVKQEMFKLQDDKPKVCAQIECDSHIGHIIEILMQNIHDNDNNLWSVNFHSGSTNEKHFLRLYKDDNEVSLPSFENLTHDCNKIFESVQQGWLQVDPTTRKDIELRDEPSKYILLIKKIAWPKEEWLLMYMGLKYGICSFFTSNMFIPHEQNTLGF